MLSRCDSLVGAMASGKTYNFAQRRQQIPVLVICANGTVSNQVRQALKTVGFSMISAAPSHVTGVDRIKGRDFALILFDAVGSDMPALDFVTQAVGLDSNSTLIAISAEPRVDDVFGLLRNGARGFLALPFTVDTVEEVIMNASEGPPLSEAVLNAPDRNAALVGVVLNNLYKVSVLMRQAREFSSAARELQRQQYSLSESMDMARLFSEGGDDLLLEKIVEGCINRANTASTRLGRTRKKLQKERSTTGADDAEEGTTGR
jgi:DNA-binding response OmpR family regulator